MGNAVHVLETICAATRHVFPVGRIAGTASSDLRNRILQGLASGFAARGAVPG